MAKLENAEYILKTQLLSREESQEGCATAEEVGINQE